MYATVDHDVKSGASTDVDVLDKQRKPGTFTSDSAKKAVATKTAIFDAVNGKTVESFRALAEADKEAMLRNGLMENEFIAQQLDRATMLSPNKKERTQTGFAVRVGIYNDKRNKQGSQSAPQNLIINLFNGGNAGPRLSQALSCHAMVERAAQVVDVIESAPPLQGDDDYKSK